MSLYGSRDLISHFISDVLVSRYVDEKVGMRFRSAHMVEQIAS